LITIIIISVILVLFAFALFGIRLLLVKNGEFRGTCAGNSPYLRREGIACGVCGAKPGEDCAKEEKPKAQNQA
jgi:flagellar basal body-associated protein FliL